MVSEGDYREDLLYRLNGVTVELPPLRDRREDIPLLIQHFLGAAKRELNKPDLTGLSPDAVEVLTNYDWPGNVRQLRAVVRRCVLDSSMPVIVPDVLPKELRHTAATNFATATKSDAREGSQLPELVDRLIAEKSNDIYAESVAYLERYVIMRVLKETGGNQSQAAEMLGITRGKLRDRISTFGIVLENEVKIEK